MYKMRKLEEFVIEKLKVSKENTISLDTSIYELSSHDEFNTYLRKVNKWLHSFATKVPKNKSNKNILNNDDLYISIDIDGKFRNGMLSIGNKKHETTLFIPVWGEEVMKDDSTGTPGWRVYDEVFIVPDELKDDVIEIINYKI